MCKRIVLTRRTLEELDGLEDHARLKVVNMFLDYSFGRETDMTGMDMEAMMVYMEMRKDAGDYADLCEKRTKAGRKGLESRWGGDCSDSSDNISDIDSKDNKDSKDSKISKISKTSKTSKNSKTGKNGNEKSDEATPISPCAHTHDARENYSSSNILDNNIILSAKADESISAEPKVDPHPSHAATSGKSPGERTDFAAIKSYWNGQIEKTGSRMRRLTLMSEQRKSTVRARLQDVGGDIGKIYQAIDIAMSSPFMNGKNARGWVGTYDWIMSPKNFVKVLEGNYTDDTSVETGQESREEKIQRLVKEAQNDKERNRRGWIAPRHTAEEYERLNCRPEGYRSDWQQDAKLVSDGISVDQNRL